MIPAGLIPKNMKTVFAIVGGAVLFMTAIKLYQDIQLNKEKLEDAKG